MALVTYNMLALSEHHQAVVWLYFQTHPAAIKWDNTGRAQDPEGRFPPACIARTEWDAWRRVNNNRLKGVPAGLLWATDEDLNNMQCWFDSAGVEQPYAFPVGRRKGGDPSNIQLVTREGFDKFKLWKAIQQEAEVGAVKGNRAALTEAGSGILAAPPKDAPACPKHGERMRYEPKSGKFLCPEHDCNVSATPKNNKARFEDSVLKGDFELIHVGGDKHLVRHLATGAIIDFGDLVQPIGTGEIHGQDGEYAMLLQFTGRRDGTGEYDEDDDE